MDAYEALKETFDDLFQQAVEEGCYTEDEAAELVESLDIYSLLQVVRHNATTVYSYITQGRQERSFNYRGEDLFRQKASLLYEETDQVTMEIVVATRTLELWLLEDMSLAVVSCVSVNYDHDGYITQYRTIKDTPVMDSELCLDLGELVKDLNGLSREQFFEAVKEKFELEEIGKEPYAPAEKGTFGMYLDNTWYALKVLPQYKNADPVKGLDVSILQDQLLGPVLGIGDPRTDKRIDFIGGIRGLKELERRVSEDMEIAFSMYPTSIEELLAVADAGLLMPPKSTWFEPKLRSGLFIHRLS